MKIGINFFYQFDYIIFDFDGVILDTNHIKTFSFKRLFRKFSKYQIDKFIDYHKKFGGISRYEKIRYFFESNNIKIENNIYKNYINNYSNLVKKKLLKQNMFQV